MMKSVAYRLTPVKKILQTEIMKFFTKRLTYPPGNMQKFPVLIRLTLAFVILGMMQVKASICGQQITNNKKNALIYEVFKVIKNQTGFDVLWQEDTFNANKKIDFNFLNSPVDFMLSKCVSLGDDTCEVQKGSIIIKARHSPNTSTLSEQDSLIFKGRVVDENGRAMGGATVKVKGSSRSTFTTSKGNFAAYASTKAELEISYIGYITKTITLNGISAEGLIEVELVPGDNNLGEVNIVSTGYQDIAKERATGSFEVITKEQLQHSIDPNLIKRLEGITTSMDFNNQLRPVSSANTSNISVASTSPSKSPLANLTIRGRNTLNANLITPGNQSGQVLVVIDGVASAYPIDNINPDEVESITVLKDAAAASIWGSRASNGVIVVKTKQGEINKPLRISFNYSSAVTEKPDLYYKKMMSTSDFIDFQTINFQLAQTPVNAPSIETIQRTLSPVVEILVQQRNGQITANEANAQLNILRGNDLRKDFNRYILRNSSTQNYSLGIDGGTKSMTHRLSVGFNKALGNSVAANDDRLSAGYNATFRTLKKLELGLSINFSVLNTSNQASESSIFATINPPYYPYTRLADDQGNPLQIPYKYRPVFADLLASTYGNKIQNLQFFPLRDIDEGYNRSTFKNLSFNLNAKYAINDWISLSTVYAYGMGMNRNEYLNSENSFYMRDLITYFTSPSGVKSIPAGARYRINPQSLNNRSLRTQININKTIRAKHVLNAIAGAEATQNTYLTQELQYYGYNESTLTSFNQLDYKDPVPTLFDATGFGSTDMISYTPTNFLSSSVRTVSFYANGAYTYSGRYTISGSIRKDMSSEFGIGANNGRTPFFSVGGKWNISGEDFYQISILPTLQLRTTFGYNGNVNPSVQARPTISYSGSNQINNLLSATPSLFVTNRELRPEKTGILNIGLDFGFKNQRISGSVEFYDKRTTDLIASNAVDPSTGTNRATLNAASLHAWGTDFSLATQNLQLGKFGWTSNFLFSYNRVKVSKLFTPSARLASDVLLTSPSYNLGADLSRIYAFRWAGLDHLTGRPMGYNNGVPVPISNSNAFNAIAALPMSSTRYFGSAVPVYYGSLRNTFRYGSFTLSANILFKLGYYFRRPNGESIVYNSLFDGVLQGAEYGKRWQRPGDELITNVPALVFPAFVLADRFYQFAEINVQKGDHIRFQEVNLSYTFNKKDWFLKNPRLYANVTNLGIIWRANSFGLDPEAFDYPNPRTISFGCSANF